MHRSWQFIIDLQTTWSNGVIRLYDAIEWSISYRFHKATEWTKSHKLHDTTDCNSYITDFMICGCILQITGYSTFTWDNTVDCILQYLTWCKRGELYLADYKILDLGSTQNRSVHRWINPWLSGRTQQVVLDSQASVPVPVLSSVPQGWVLCRVLFRSAR